MKKLMLIYHIFCIVAWCFIGYKLIIIGASFYKIDNINNAFLIFTGCLGCFYIALDILKDIDK